MEHLFALTLSHATEVGAIAAARAMGFGDRKLADRKAVAAMRTYLNSVEFSGKIVIGEGERDEAPMLYIGERLGKRRRDREQIPLDIAVDPLENTNATAMGLWNAISALAASEPGGLFHAPDMYMEKLVVGKEAAGKVHTDLARGFIRAETVAYDDLVAHQDMKGARAAGKVRKEGKTYVVADGDILNILANA